MGSVLGNVIVPHKHQYWEKCLDDTSYQKGYAEGWNSFRRNGMSIRIGK